MNSKIIHDKKRWQVCRKQEKEFPAEYMAWR